MLILLAHEFTEHLFQPIKIEGVSNLKISYITIYVKYIHKVCECVCVYIYIYKMIQQYVEHRVLWCSVVKNPPTNAGDMSSIPSLQRSHEPWTN